MQLWQIVRSPFFSGGSSLCRLSQFDKFNEEKRSERRKHCALAVAEPKIFAPPQTPFPGAQDDQNLISWRRSLPSPTDPVWRNRCTQFRVIVVTDPQTHKQRPPAGPPVANTQTGPITIHCAAKLSAQCNNDQIRHSNPYCSWEGADL